MRGGHWRKTVQDVLKAEEGSGIGAEKGIGSKKCLFLR
jgi:hypothetical protein